MNFANIPLRIRATVNNRESSQMAWIGKPSIYPLEETAPLNHFKQYVWTCIFYVLFMYTKYFYPLNIYKTFKEALYDSHRKADSFFSWRFSMQRKFQWKRFTTNDWRLIAAQSISIDDELYESHQKCSSQSMVIISMVLAAGYTT